MRAPLTKQDIFGCACKHNRSKLNFNLKVMFARVMKGTRHASLQREMHIENWMMRRSDSVGISWTGLSHAWHTLSIDPKLPKLLKQHILKQTPVCWPMELPFSTHTQLGRCTTVNCSAQCWFHTGCGFSKIAHKTEILSCPPVLLWCVRLHVYECYCSVSALCMLLLYECSVHTHGWVQ